jgi:hypothetical protein
VKTEMDVADQAAGGYVDTDIVEQVPMGRFAAPDDIAETIAFLADPLASGFVNGVTLPSTVAGRRTRAGPASVCANADQQGSGDAGVTSITRNTTDRFIPWNRLLPQRQRALLIVLAVLGWSAQGDASLLEATAWLR